MPPSDPARTTDPPLPDHEPPRRGVLIVNSRSRRGKLWFEASKTTLESMGIDLLSAATFRTMPELVAEVTRSIEAGVPLVVIGGGDGTFSAVARLFAHRKTVMGVLPLGTGNAFARDLGVPGDLSEACEVIASGKVSEVDLGTIGDRSFLNIATVGLSTMIAQELTQESKRRFGKAVYGVALLRALLRVRPFVARLESTEGVLEFETLQLVIGNGRFHAGPFPISPDASLLDGRLHIYALATRSRSAFFRLALHLRSGRQGDLPEVHALSTGSGRLDTSPPQQVTVDGEVCLRTPVSFRVSPGALHVITPQGFPP
jgi:diacylglycerol kinase (ATP)